MAPIQLTMSEAYEVISTAPDSVTADYCWKKVIKDINEMHIIPTLYKTQKLCDYAAKCRIELILFERGIPLTFRRPWMYHDLLQKQLFYISHIPEIYIPSYLLLLPLKFKAQRHMKRQHTHYKLLHRCITRSTTIYQDHKKQNNDIKKELLIFAWAPYRVKNWCLDVENQKRISVSFLL